MSSGQTHGEQRPTARLTFHIEFRCGDCRAGREGVLSAVSKVNVPDAQSVSELFATSLASVRGFDLHAIFQPFVRDSLVVDVDLECDRVFFLSVQVLQHRRDQNSWNNKQKFSKLLPLRKEYRR